MQTGPVSQTASAPSTAANRQQLIELFRARQISDEELMVNLALYMRSGALARLRHRTRNEALLVDPGN